MPNIYKIRSEVEYVPYTYIIGWRSLKVYYFGSESSIITKIANPANLWTFYFTSSDHVSRFRIDHGEPDIIKVVRTYSSADDARAAEAAYLTRINAALRPNWLNQHNGTDKFHTCGHKRITDGTSNKMIPMDQTLPDGWYYGESPTSKHNRTMVIRQRKQHFNAHARESAIAARINTHLCNNGIQQKYLPIDVALPVGWVKGMLPIYADLASERMLGHRHTESTKSLIGKQHRGDKWFTNGIKEVHTVECPQGYWQGRLPVTEQALKNRSESHKGFKWFTDGVQSKQFKDLSAVPDNWWPGRTCSKSKKGRKPYIVSWMWITDESRLLRHPKHEPIPTGWRQGKPKKLKEPQPIKERNKQVGRKDQTVYHFYHPEHGEHRLTKDQFQKAYNLSNHQISYLFRRNPRDPKNWRVI